MNLRQISNFTSRIHFASQEGVFSNARYRSSSPDEAAWREFQETRHFSILFSKRRAWLRAMSGMCSSVLRSFRSFLCAVVTWPKELGCDSSGPRRRKLKYRPRTRAESLSRPCSKKAGGLCRLASSGRPPQRDAGRTHQRGGSWVRRCSGSTGVDLSFRPA